MSSFIARMGMSAETAIVDYRVIICQQRKTNFRSISDYSKKRKFAVSCFLFVASKRMLPFSISSVCQLPPV
jgi:hypothetical protein